MLYLPIAGTWSRHGGPDPAAWYRRGSPFDRHAEALGLRRVEQDRDPTTPDAGYWSGDLGGTLLRRAWPPWADPHRPWRDGGRDLRAFLEGRWDGFDEAGGVLIIAHSHGGQVAAYALGAIAAAWGMFRYLPCAIRLITVDMPVRRELRPVYAEAAQVITSWTHLYSERGWAARMRWLGNRFGPRRCRAAHRNIEVAGGHSGVLSDPDYLGQWGEILERTL